MNTFITILFWLGILFTVDGSLGILFQEKWKKLVGEINIERLALMEIGVGSALLIVHFLLGSGG